MSSGRPESDEIPAHLVGYVGNVPESDPVAVLATQIDATAALLRGLSETDARPLADLVADLRATRAATLALFRSFDADAWRRRGTASGKPVSVRALGYVIPGHERHHVEILKTRYGVR